jgi:hypothetical protein
MSELSILDIVQKLREAVANRPDAAALRDVRDKLDAPAFRREVREFMRAANSDETRDRLSGQLIGLQRDAEELQSKLLGEQRLVSTIGIGGGVGLAGAGIVTAITLAVPALALIPVVAGVYMTFRYSGADRQLTEEATICGQIVEELKAIRGEIKND